MPRLWNYFQRHYLKTTKQTAERTARPLYMKDFEYLLRVKFGQGMIMSASSQDSWKLPFFILFFLFSKLLMR
jgi:hypothetical protein